MRRNLQREYVLRARDRAGAAGGDRCPPMRARCCARMRRALRARARAGRRIASGAVAGSEGAPRRSRSRMIDEALKAPLVRQAV